MGLSLALAVASLTAVTVGAAAPVAERPTLTSTLPPGGPPSSPLSYQYAWTYSACAAGALDPAHLVVVLVWDTPPVVLGSSTVTVDAAANLCGGVVTGVVPAGSAPGPHPVSAYLQDPGNGGARVPRSAADAAQPFTVTPAPTATPSPTPSASPSPLQLSLPSPKAIPRATAVAAPPPLPSIPIPTPTPSDTSSPTATASPAATAAPTPSPAIVPTTAGRSGGISPPGGWLLDLTVAAVVLAGAAVTIFLLARLRRTEPPRSPHGEEVARPGGFEPPTF